MRGDGNPDLELVERNLEQPLVCGLTRIIAGKEWVCVRTAHDDPPRPGHGHRSEQWYHGYAPRSERHHFRRRYPNSDH